MGRYITTRESHSYITWGIILVTYCITTYLSAKSIPSSLTNVYKRDHAKYSENMHNFSQFNWYFKIQNKFFTKVNIKNILI